jgi:hypothetical protein
MIRRPWPLGRRARTTAATAAVVLLSAILAPALAGASPDRGQALGPERVSDGTWGAAVTPTALSWSLASGARQTSTVNNTGSVAVTAMTYKVVMSNGLSLATFTLAACTIPWVGGLCSGGAGTAIGGTYRLGSTTTITSSVVPPVGGSIYLQGIASSLSVTTITMTLTVSVTAKTQTRAKVVTNQ